MARALRQAWISGKAGEAPVGALVVEAATGRIVSQAGNAPIRLSDPTAHAEILAIRDAGRALGNYRLGGCLLVVTLEPCLMCVGAVIHARLDGVVFGARDPKAGALVSNLDGAALPFANHRPAILEGVLASECGATLSRFFASRRKARNG